MEKANRLPNRVAPNILYQTDVRKLIQTIKELVGFVELRAEYNHEAKWNANEPCK